jgi:hypothetical protein
MFGITTRAVHVRLFRARERFRALIHQLAADAANENSPRCGFTPLTPRNRSTLNQKPLPVPHSANRSISY